MAHDHQKSYADLKRLDRYFAIGEMVFLRVKPKKSYLRLVKFKKLAFKYYGPYQITKRIGTRAYELLLPPYVRIHNVFHVSLLRKYVPNPHHVLDKLQRWGVEPFITLSPLQATSIGSPPIPARTHRAGQVGHALRKPRPRTMDVRHWQSCCALSASPEQMEQGGTRPLSACVAQEPRPPSVLPASLRVITP